MGGLFNLRNAFPPLLPAHQTLLLIGCRELAKGIAWRHPYHATCRCSLLSNSTESIKSA